VVKRPSRWVWVPADKESPEVPAGFPVLPPLNVPHVRRPDPSAR
jgi:hypothetical protein